ncbi:MAG: UPF0182 family protein [Balneolaceae bacterium]|nr:UPF0182 family protein [Balneolaceae bacterium]
MSILPNVFKKKRTWILLVFLILLLVGAFTDWIVEYLWLDALGYSPVFWTIKKTQLLLMGGALLVALGYVMTNMNLLARNVGSLPSSPSPLGQLDLGQIDRSKIKGTLMGAGALISVFFSMAFFMRWDTYFRFHWSEVFGQADPIFGNDIGFYVFRLPFLELIQNSLTLLVFFTVAACAVIYLYAGTLSVREDGKGVSAPRPVSRHLNLNLGLWLLLLAWGYFLERYQLLYKDNGVVYGADYVDMSVTLPVLWVLFVACLLLAAVAFWQLYKPRFKWLLGGAAAVLVIGGVGQAVLPPAVQSLRVNPNELQLQTPYIEHNIAQTRQAYELDQMNVRNYEAGDTLSRAKLQQNQSTVDNIRLWDPRLIIQTYRQLQEIRSYYQFYNVDIDRYRTGEGYMQMMLSARELTEELPPQADTWVNRRLQYTHGYGLAMSPVAQVGRSGDPRLVIRDLPPVTEMGLTVDQPAIYFGEHNSDYKIVNTDVQELDYPRGDQNVYTSYQGGGGVSINSFLERLLFAWQFGDMNMLLTNYINEGSRIIFWKRTRERVQRIAPFLELRDRPYLVLSEGELKWIQDAYTLTPDYPYSEPAQGGYNYIRNSVKVVVDAYDGSVDFYAMTEEDPILNVYRDIFPGMFTPLEEMPEDLKGHLRYPQHIFQDQIAKYNVYHMTDPQVFYNNEDLWTRPNEKYGGQQIPMEPYYILTRLPGEEELQYLLISPLTPANRDNMIGWMAAKNDFPDYGEVSVFQLPKERLILGPAQIEAKIDQDTEISRQLSLWDQRGSSVIRGNLMVIPIEDSFLYVEPVFLIAQGVDIPQLQRVIVTAGDQIAMQPTLQQGIDALYEEDVNPVALDTSATPQPPPPALGADTAAAGEAATTAAELTSEQVDRLRTLWQEARAAMRDGNWTLYGQKMDEIGRLLNGSNNP